MSTVGYIFSFDGNASSAVEELYVQKLDRGMFGAVRDALIEVPGRDGAYLFTERRGNRTIVAQCVVIADPTSRFLAVREIADILDRDGYRRLIFSDQPDRYWNAAMASDIPVDEWKEAGRFNVTWTAEPYAYAISPSSMCVTAAPASAVEFDIPDTVDAYPVVEITPLNGTIVGGFSLTTNGLTLTYSGDVTQGNTITISSLSYTVTTGQNTDLELTGAFTPGTIFPADVSGDFPILLEGTNTVSITLSGGTATLIEICFTWRRRYR